MAGVVVGPVDCVIDESTLGLVHNTVRLGRVMMRV